MKKDRGQPIKTKEQVNFSIPSGINRFFHFITLLEFSLDKLLPNFMGGSIIGIAQKE
jgi:hypothetical protein